MDYARSLETGLDPAGAFFTFLSFMIQEDATDRVLADALTGAGFDIHPATTGSAHDTDAVMQDLLTHAQRSGTVRDDVDMADVKALIAGCLARERTAVDLGARNRMLAIVSRGLSPEPDPPPPS